MTSSIRECIDTARRHEPRSPMWNTACSVCHMRGLDPFEHQWFEGEWLRCAFAWKGGSVMAAHDHTRMDKLVEIRIQRPERKS